MYLGLDAETRSEKQAIIYIAYSVNYRPFHGRERECLPSVCNIAYLHYSINYFYRSCQRCFCSRFYGLRYRRRENVEAGLDVSTVSERRIFVVV